MKALAGELHNKIKAIKCLILDVDGVLTDGGIVFDDEGRQIKRFDVRDGHGLKMLMRYGIDVVLLTGRTSQAVLHRALDLGIEDVHQGAKNKLDVYQEILRKKNILASATAFVGDDVVDVPVLRRVGFSVTVADAAEDVKKLVDYITEKNGGRGAVREVCELILQVQGHWAELAARYEL